MHPSLILRMPVRHKGNEAPVALAGTFRVEKKDELWPQKAALSHAQGTNRVVLKLDRLFGLVLMRGVIGMCMIAAMVVSLRSAVSMPAMVIM
jgi:hypothetical protein